jgi:hypothetical protein
MGSAPNRWVATGEFQRIADRRDRSDHCVCAADNGGLVLEAHLGDGNYSAMIRLSTDQKHPQLGNGLHGALTLPTAGDMKSIVDRCAGLNLIETMWTGIPQFGCWFPVSLENDQASIQFASFIPNALYGEGIADLTVVWLYQRARWVAQREYPT